MMPNSKAPRRGHTLAATIPPGYHELPLHDIDKLLDISASAITDSTPEPLRDSVPNILGTLGFFLQMLETKNAVYCGIGKHASIDGEPVTSWLIVSVMDYGKPQNPRLVVRDLAEYKLAEDTFGEVVAVDINGRPMMFTERVQSYPTPDFPRTHPTGDIVPVFQAEAVVPSDDGSSIAVVEFSTVSVDQGTQYRAMMFAIADSLQFVESRSTTSSLDL